MEKKQVLLSVMGWTHDDDEPSDSVRLLTTGTLAGRKDAWRIDYAETQPDNETNFVTLKMDHGVVTMERSGPYALSLIHI